MGAAAHHLHLHGLVHSPRPGSDLGDPVRPSHSFPGVGHIEGGWGQALSGAAGHLRADAAADGYRLRYLPLGSLPREVRGLHASGDTRQFQG